MLYGPQNIFGSAKLTPSQRAAQQRRKEAAARIADAARAHDGKTDDSASPAPVNPQPQASPSFTPAGFFESAWQMLEAPTMRAEQAASKRLLGSWPVQKIQEAVCHHYHITMAEMTSTSRTQELTRPRQVAMYLSRILTGRSLPEIGRRFGQRRHTTVLHAVRVISSRLLRDAPLKRDIALITERLTTQSDRAP